MISTKDFAFLGCRLLSLFVLYQVAHNLGLALIWVVQAFQLETDHAQNALFSLLSSAVIVSLDLALFLFFWFGANWIAGRMIKSARDETGQDGWSHSHVLSLAVTILGLFILATTLPDTISYVRYLGLDSANPDGALRFLLTLGLGVGCVLGPGAIADFVVKLRRW